MVSSSTAGSSWLPMLAVATFVLLALGSSSVAAASASASGGGNVEDIFDEDYYDSRERILQSSYHGLIKENETIVEITPLIKVDETKICDFHIVKRNPGSGSHDIPFDIELVNNLGILRAKRTLNCEKHRTYKFHIVAIFCDGAHSSRANVHISVIDINEYSPVFAQPSYVTEVDEGRLYQEVIRVEATDRDCTPLFGDVCKYDILTADQPFAIDNEGAIRNTEPLSHRASHNHILSVVAYDCAMKQSAPVMVNIRVRRVCEARLLAVPERIEFVAAAEGADAAVSLFPKVRLELCDMQCKDEALVIEATVALKTKHISFGCDRDASHCAPVDLIDLLPKDADWTKDLVVDEGPDAVFHFDGSTGATVPGTLLSHHDFALRPFAIVTQFRHHSGTGGAAATGAIEAAVGQDADAKHIKEHIICSADDHKMNRHHMALFVRNCRLILLLRKNFNEGDLNIFSPAEWRWKIPQVCDNEWHSYALNVDPAAGGRVELHIDGVRFEANAEDRHTNPEVIDDWPMHAAHGVNTTLTVGACLQGAENRMKHGFGGDIAAIRVALARTLTAEEIRCGTDCAEHLVAPPERWMEPAQQVQSNVQLSEISVAGSNRTNVERLLQGVQYVNTKRLPTIGRRNIEIRATVSCPNHKAIRLPTMETYIMVSPAIVAAAAAASPSTNAASPAIVSPTASPLASVVIGRTAAPTSHVHDMPVSAAQRPQIRIDGPAQHLVTYLDIKHGVRLLRNATVRIVSGQWVRDQLQQLDSCAVTVSPSLNPDHETIALLPLDDSVAAGADHQVAQLDNDVVAAAEQPLDIKTRIGKDGVELIGYDTTANYERLLHGLVYTNRKPAYYLNRVFKVSCAQVSGQFRSAEFTLTLTVLHPKQTPTAQPSAGPVANVAAGQQQQHESSVFAHAMVHSHDVQESGVRVHNIVQKVGQGSHSTMLIVVICAAFVLLIGGVGVARLRNNSADGEVAANERHMRPCPKLADQQPQMDWDDSALTITINPMQAMQLGQCGPADGDEADGSMLLCDGSIAAGGRGAAAAGGVGGGHVSLSDDSSDSENSDSEDDEPTNGRYRNVSQLEWDNSTM